MKQLKTPILFLTFNRLDTTQKVFAEIRKVKPKRLFVAADGPRTSEERKITDSVRNWILKNIDWKCSVKTLFRDKNLGCRYASVSAIDWFFKNVEQGIILEDDCLPNQSFFRFCEEMLEKYKHEEKIMSISGYNYLMKVKILESYFFSKYFGSWGCALWKRSWKKLDLELKSYLEFKRTQKLKEFYPSFFERIIWKKRINDVLNKRVDSWMYPFSITHILNKGLCIIPKNNLIENLGLGPGMSTHLRGNPIDRKFLFVESKEIRFPLVHPRKIELNKKLSEKFIKKEINKIILKKLLFWKR